MDFSPLGILGGAQMPSRATAPQLTNGGAYGMFDGDPAIVKRLMAIIGRPGLSDEERQYGATAYAQDYQKRMEAMQQPSGPFGQMGFDERRAAQADKENNMFNRLRDFGI